MLGSSAMSNKFLQCVRGGWLERKLSVVAGDRDLCIDLRYPSRSGLKGGRLTIGNVAKLAIKRNSRIFISTESSMCSNCSNIPLKKRKRYHKIPDVGMRCAVLTSFVL
jgi:hypothetical protein